MKTIGLLGGMSWESTVSYYQAINRTVAAKLGGLHSAKIVLYSVDFDEIERCQAAGDWALGARILSDAAQSVERAGADFLLISTNTMHKVYEEIQSALKIPVLHIADLTGDELLKSGIRKVGLLGTKYTMEQAFYKSRLAARGIDVLIPDEDGRQMVNNVIYDELCRGILNPVSKAEYLRVIDELCARGAEGIILGCTEIGLLIQQPDTTVALFDTAQIHAARAALYAIEA